MGKNVKIATKDGKRVNNFREITREDIEKLHESLRKAMNKSFNPKKKKLIIADNESVL